MKLNKLITEIKLSRIWNHVVNDKKAIGLITAFRGDKTTEDNMKLNKELAYDIRKEGYGYVFIEGNYIENIGKADERKVKEDSLLVIGSDKDNGKLKFLLKKLIKKYNQDAAIYKNEAIDTAILISIDGTEVKLGKIQFNKISDFMTQLKKGSGTFTFENLVFEKNIFSKLLEKYKY